VVNATVRCSRCCHGVVAAAGGRGGRGR
jgi:hypothetical protein